MAVLNFSPRLIDQLKSIGIPDDVVMFAQSLNIPWVVRLVDWVVRLSTIVGFFGLIVIAKPLEALLSDALGPLPDGNQATYMLGLLLLSLVMFPIVLFVSLMHTGFGPLLSALGLSHLRRDLDAGWGFLWKRWIARFNAKQPANLSPAQYLTRLFLYMLRPMYWVAAVSLIATGVLLLRDYEVI